MKKYAMVAIFALLLIGTAFSVLGYAPVSEIEPEDNFVSAFITPRGSCGWTCSWCYTTYKKCTIYGVCC